MNQQQQKKKCPRCGGSGRLGPKLCPECFGHGTVKV